MPDIERDREKRPDRSDEQRTFLNWKPSQYDPGIYRLLNGLEFGYLDVVDGTECWAVYSPQPNLPAALMPYVPPGTPGTVGVFESVLLRDPIAPDDLDAFIPYEFDRIDVPIIVNPAVAATGDGGVPPTTPYLFLEGKFDILQNQVKVGDLVVEHSGSRDRKQYWFLYTHDGTGTGTYRWPGRSNRDVSTVFRLASAYPRQLPLAAFRAGLPPHQFLLGNEHYFKTFVAG